MDSKTFLSFCVFMRRVQQSFGGNTADVQTRATEDGFILVIVPLLHTGGLKTLLCSANGRNITGRSSADNYHIIFISHIHSYLLIFKFLRLRILETPEPQRSGWLWLRVIAIRTTGWQRSMLRSQAGCAPDPPAAPLS